MAMARVRRAVAICSVKNSGSADAPGTVRRHRAGPAAVAVATQMALMLVHWQQMVRYLKNHR